MKSPNIKYLPAVDHLRGFAAALIVFYHGLHLISYEMKFNAPFSFSPWPETNNPFLAVLIEGHTAVALFMVLSGFIFAYGALGREIAYLPFIRNRFLRIYPLFIVLIVLGLLVYPERFSVLGLVNSLLFRANTTASLPLGAFSAMFWAIAVEFQFYLLFPLLHKIWRRLGGWSMAGLLIGTLLFKGLAAARAESVRDLAYFTLVGRMDQFLIGMVLAWVFQRTREYDKIKARAFPLAGLMILALLFGFHKLAGGWPTEGFFKIYWPTVEGAVWALAILGYLSAANSLPARISDWLARLGRVSYSTYLLHFFLISYLVQWGWFLDFGLSPEQNALVNTVLLIFPLVTVSATVSFKLIEAPFLNLRKRYFVEVQPAG